MLAHAISLYVSQVKRYELGKSQPTLDVLRRLAVTLNVSGDLLLFDKEERGEAENLRIQIEAISQLAPPDREAVTRLIEAMIVKKNVENALNPPHKKVT